MSRRSKKKYNQNFAPLNPYPGSSWQSPAPLNAWDNVSESFWGFGNYSNFNQQRKGNDQWRPGDRGRNRKVPPPQKSSGSNKEMYQWSTEKTPECAASSTGLANNDKSSSNNKEHSPPLNDRNTTSKDMKIMRREQNKQLKEGLSKPVECSVAERMMQKMGWQGGGLGVKEEGRTEPIEVNLKFINKTTGLGHNEKEKVQWSRLQKKQKQPALQKLMPNQLMTKLPMIPVLYLQPVTLDLQRKPIENKTNKKLKKQCLKKNKRNTHATIDHYILDIILDFVMDVKQTEYAFDLNYSRQERRIIHNFIQYIRDGFNEEVYFDFDELHLAKIDEINEYNNYVLVTESQGVHPNRQLFMYKEAPDEVYLVTRDDLIEYEEKDELTNENSNKTEPVSKNIAKKEIKTPNLTKDSNAKDLKTKLKTDLDKQLIETENNSIAKSMITELTENIHAESEMVTDTNKTQDATEVANVKTVKSIDLDVKSIETDHNCIAKSVITELIDNIPDDSQMVVDTNKTQDLIEVANAKDVKSDENIDFLEKPEDGDCSIIVHSMLTELMENIPEESQLIINTNSKSDNKLTTKLKIKNKHTVADFIENCSKKRKSEVATHNIDIDKAYIITNNLNTSENHATETLQEKEFDIKPTNSKDAIEIKQEEVIEIDLTESEDPISIEPNTFLQNPKTQPKNEVTVKEDGNENEMDVELNKIRGQPKLEHLENAFYIYLKDFLKHDVYIEMRFLGDFDDEENGLLSKLLSDICAVSDKSKHFDCFGTVDVYKELHNNEAVYLQLEADINGGDVIYKIPRKTGDDSI